MSRLYRRSRWLTARWEGNRIEVTNYLAGTAALIAPDDAAVLSALTYWRDVDDLAAVLPRGASSDLDRLVQRFETLQFVDRPGRRASPRERALAEWSGWDPIAARFHLGTRDERYASRAAIGDVLERRRVDTPPPAPLKAMPGQPSRLPPHVRTGAFPGVLLGRRSWRRFSRQPVSLEQFANLTGLTFAVQEWARFDGQELALKTSPSGGACHSIEVYWAINRVDGLMPGLYHYDPDGHGLTPVRPEWTWERIRRYFVEQPWFADTAAVALMTSMFERTRWKYRSPRAYRVIQLEAGHLCQTFALTATWLGLAPCCSAAFADSEIEQDLGVDGISEAVLYAAGVGHRPPDTTWAPYPESDSRPETRAPSHRADSGRTQR